MKRNMVRYGMIVLLIGLSALAAGRTYAQDSDSVKRIDVLSFSWGISTGQIARVSVAHLGDGSGRFVNPPVGSGLIDQPLDIRLELRDALNNVIAQSDVIRVEPVRIPAIVNSDSTRW